MIVGIEERCHGPSDAMHNPSQPFEFLSKETYTNVGVEALIPAKSDSLPHTHTQALNVKHSDLDLIYYGLAKLIRDLVEILEALVIIVVSSCRVFQYRVVGLTGHTLLLYLDIPEVERSHDEYRKKHKLSPPLLICKYCLEDPDKERLRNIYSLAFLLGQNPETYMFTNIGNVCHCLLDVTQDQALDDDDDVISILSLELRYSLDKACGLEARILEVLDYAFDICIRSIDFTLDDVLDEPAGVGGTIEPPKCVTGTPSSLEYAKLEDVVKRPEPSLQRG
ncbi:hypothetical protein Tco_0180593 [Tanacetum coccineum]